MSKTQTTSPQKSARDVRSLLRHKNRELLNELLEMKQLSEFLQNLTPDDFFRIVKRIGEDDALPVLAQASEDQWQYLLDLEVWSGDLLDTDSLIIWLDRLNRADTEKLARWIASEQGDLAIMVLSRRAEVIFKEDEGEWDVPPGFFTLDGHFYIKAVHKNDTPILEQLLGSLARHNFEAYQGLLLDLALQTPSETEDQLYRRRSERLVEYGFVPTEEALEVYAPLDADTLSMDPKPLLPGALVGNEERHLIPAAPFEAIADFRLLVDAMQRISDPLIADRVRLEFTSLCNMLIAADSFACVDDYEHLRGIGRQAAGYLHIALEKLCAEDAEAASRLMGNHSLITIFRVGYGFAAELRSQCKRWLGHSWFSQNVYQPDFWDNPWEEILEGVLLPHPMYYDQCLPTPFFRPFESLAEVTQTDVVLHQIQALDRMLANLTQVSPGTAAASGPTFHPLLFNRWARHLLNMEPGFGPLSKRQAAKFFRILRGKELSAPYGMDTYQNAFLDEFLKGATGFEPETAASLHDALDEIWTAFCREYEYVEAKHLDTRWSKYLLIEDKKSPRVHQVKARLDR